MDALNNVIQALRLKPQIFHRMQQAAPWGISFSIANAAAFHAVEQGTCWLRLSGQLEPIQLETGDIIVVSNTFKYELSDTRSSLTIPLDEWLRRTSEQSASNTRPIETSTTTTLICSEFHAGHNLAYPLFSLIPPLILVKNINGRPIDWLAMPFDIITSESQTQYPGYETVISRILDILFIMVIRYWIAHHSPSEGGWLGALYHPQIGTVLNRIHTEPAHPWTLAALSQIAHMSRSNFSAQFTAVVGESPMQYLTRWRMQLASNWLVDNPTFTVEQVAQQTGYTSVYAFSKAFKRVVGYAPSLYRDRQING